MAKMAERIAKKGDGLLSIGRRVAYKSVGWLN